MKKNYLKWLNRLEKVLGPSSALDELRLQVEALPEEEKTQRTIELKPLPPDELKDYGAGWLLATDGACRGNPGVGAWAYVIQDKNGEIIKEDAGHALETTNNRMELMGAIEGLKHLHSAPKGVKLIFLCDSKYVVEGLMQWTQQWKQRGWKKADGKAPENIDLWQKLDEVVHHLPPHEVKWVRGHSGHPQNEYCDQKCNELLDDVENS